MKFQQHFLCQKDMLPYCIFLTVTGSSLGTKIFPEKGEGIEITNLSSIITLTQRLMKARFNS